jgi:hypothetical protein
MGYGNTYEELLDIVKNKKNLEKGGDTYYSFSNLTKEQIDTLAELVGYEDGRESWYELTQNDSPTIGEFLDLDEEFHKKITYIGYVILPPRDDIRVSIEGFDGTYLNAEEALELMYRYGEADEKSYSKDGTVSNGITFSIGFWWD